MRNPREEIIRGKGNNDNPGIPPDLQLNSPVILSNREVIIERMVTDYVGDDTGDPNLDLSAGSKHVDSILGINNYTNGPVIKCKPKWTRFPRMGDEPKIIEEDKTHA